jgi:hypothetical protein
LDTLARLCLAGESVAPAGRSVDILMKFGMNSVTVRSICAIGCRVRHQSSAVSKRYDLFGYEVKTATGPFIEKIQKAKYYDDAGEVIVEMNLDNTPPDLQTYNALLEKILTCPSKSATPVKGECKFTAMMDILEEMDARSQIKPNATSWGYVLQELVNTGEFRLGWVAINGMKALGYTPDPKLVEANEANAAKAKAAGTDFPAILKKAAPETFETKAWGI